jgi:sugar (pentulose or hexulose) kinase
MAGAAPSAGTAPICGYIGLDYGTQGISVLFCDMELKVMAVAQSSYSFLPGLAPGHYEQNCDDWDAALVAAMKQIHKQVTNMNVLAIGISGQMHGQVLVDRDNRPLQSARLWCDARNEAEADELTAAFGVKIAKRTTAARFLYTARNQPDMATQVKHMTTPAGWTFFRLTAEWNLVIGDASGMFPIDDTTLDYNEKFLKVYNGIVNNTNIPAVESILPKIIKAGENAGCLNESGAKLLGLSVGIPVAAAEGDQVAALAGSLVARPGMVACSFGTSVCANVVVAGQSFQGISPMVDHFCAADGKPILMVWLRNGTTFLNSIVASYGDYNNDDTNDLAFIKIMALLVKAPADCDGLMALPFIDDEPGLNVAKGGSAMIIGWNSNNANVGNVTKAALLSTMFNLRLGLDVLAEQGFPLTEVNVSGGLMKTPACGQILADVLDIPVSVREAAEEGCAWGAAVMAKFRHDHVDASDWASFLESVAHTGGANVRFEPKQESVATYNQMFQRYKKLLELQPQLTAATSANEK